MNIALTALQVIIGLIFLFTGSIKLFTPKEKLSSKSVTGFENIPPKQIKWLAVAEILGALTLLIFSLPALPRQPITLTVSSFALLMIAASYHHWKRNEHKNLTVTVVILLVCLVILILK
ncbi:MAG: DoxX family protein [Saprospiraceae bacterium]|nr:DoxX family protein [Saprospiraceae bacterium]